MSQNPLPARKKVYIIGQEGICDELDLFGIPYIGGPADVGKMVRLGTDARIDHDPDVAAVVVGYDHAISYYKIQYAQLCINQNKDCKFIAANLDSVANLTEDQVTCRNIPYISDVASLICCNSRNGLETARW